MPGGCEKSGSPRIGGAREAKIDFCKRSILHPLHVGLSIVRCEIFQLRVNSVEVSPSSQGALGQPVHTDGDLNKVTSTDLVIAISRNKPHRTRNSFSNSEREQR
jgi:hypothetical protein